MGNLKTKESSRLAGLDGLRAWAVLGVIACHLTDMEYFPNVRWLKAICERGDFGVVAFFVLSGFLITWLMLAEQRKTDRVSLKMFYARRVLRICPPAFAYLAAMWALSGVASITTNHVDVLKSIFFVRNYSMHGSDETGHFWTLAVEEQFYLLWPLGFVLLSQWKSSKRILVVLGLVAFAPIWRILNVRYAGYNFTSPRFDLVYDALLVGCLLAMLRASDKFSSILNSPKIQNWGSLIVAAGLIGASELPMARENMYARSIGHTLGPVGVAILINYLVCGHKTIVDRLFNGPVLNWIGRASYSLYLWQQVFCHHIDSKLYTYQKFPLNICLSFAAAALSMYLVEQPFAALRARLSNSRPPVSVPANASTNAALAPA